MENPHLKKAEEVIKALETTEKGLTEQEAKKRLQEFGLNEIKKQKKREWVQILAEQFKNFLILLLFFAAIISAFLGEFLESVSIILVIILSAVLGFFQEFKAEKAMEKLQKLTAPNAKVIREGKEKVIKANQLVPGDIIVLEAGNIVPADARIFKETNLKVDESSLTGESIPSQKITEEFKNNCEVADRENMVYMGTIVTYGKGKAVVVGTGNNTEFGKIASTMVDTEINKTKLEQKFESLAKSLGIIVIIIISVVFLLELIKGEMEIKELLIFSLSLAVAAVPNSLPAIVTISLALGSQEMSKNKMIIRKLDAIHTLGQVDVICTDKTGTLTKNEMTVTKVFCQGTEYKIEGSGYSLEGNIEPKEKNKAINLIAKISVLCNDAKLFREKSKVNTIGDPTEIALIVLAEKIGLEPKKEIQEAKIIQEFPFDSERKMMSVVIREAEKTISLVKGAPDIIIKSCTSIIDEKGKTRKITENDKKALLEKNSSFAKDALRVIGFAYKEAKSIKNQKEAETNLVFVGIAGMMDPAREEAYYAIQQAKNAGIKVIMITGDHSETAKSIAKEIGLYEEGEIILTAEQIESMKDSELEEKIKNTTIIARALPIQKLRIIKALKKHGKIVAMTGDGVNDAPALKNADVGISMGITGTEVAKEVSSATIADDNFATIIIGIKEGKGIYEKIINSTKYLLSCNLGEITVVVGAILVKILSILPPNAPLPLTPLQILTMNLLTDGLPAIGLSFEKQKEKSLEKKQDKEKQDPIGKENLRNIVIFGLVMGTASLALFVFYFANETAKAQTIAFTTLVMLQMFAAVGSRRSKPFKSLEKIAENKILLLGIVSSIAIQLAIIYIEPLQEIFNTTEINAFDWALVIAISLLGFIIMEVQKIGAKTNQ